MFYIHPKLDNGGSDISYIEWRRSSVIKKKKKKSTHASSSQVPEQSINVLL